MMILSLAIDNIFSHNERIAIWRPITKEEDILIWQGMAHELPKKFLTIKEWKIFGTVCESIIDSDVINIRIDEKESKYGCGMV